ncbi:uncharacterized protein LOC130375042 isoform X2 [Gadus chalcogrammus]|uniref:uncharacterized protein LOC130375042 isoform X2 n=1 Tax=Gadus chalcogrammus TaxID=1042646 RepID=UPI0024C49ADB|nr:uncharacterized protein LOC130375042 isoform X2 [Gadus chalcogrammus]
MPLGVDQGSLFQQASDGDLDAGVFSTLSPGIFFYTLITLTENGFRSNERLHSITIKIVVLREQTKFAGLHQSDAHKASDRGLYRCRGRSPRPPGGRGSGINMSRVNARPSARDGRGRGHYTGDCSGLGQRTRCVPPAHNTRWPASASKDRGAERCKELGLSLHSTGHTSVEVINGDKEVQVMGYRTLPDRDMEVLDPSDNEHVVPQAMWDAVVGKTVPAMPFQLLFKFEKAKLLKLL